MGTQSAKSLNDALDKARGVGVIEETFSIGDCEVVLRNLRPEEYEAVLDECKELEDLRYLNKFQEGHLCRAIQELNGVSLRDIDFVECEEPDTKKPGHLRTVKRERFEWLRRNVLNTWGKEAIYTGYRKFSDVVTNAESKAREGVTFLTPDETAEEQFRRLAAQMKELESEVPPALVGQILQEHGYSPYTEPQDRAALDKLDDIAKADDEGGYEGGSGTPPADAPPDAPPAPPEAPPAPPKAAAAAAAPEEESLAPPPKVAPSQAGLAEALRTRRPLNQEIADIPDPVMAPPIITPPPTTAAPVVSRRSAEFMALEAEMDPDFRAAPPMGVVPPGAHVAPEFVNQAAQSSTRDAQVLEKAEAGHSDPRAFSQIVDKPPAAPMNPKFHRQG